jgi:hypothetical protein
MGTLAELDWAMSAPYRSTRWSGGREDSEAAPTAALTTNFSMPAENCAMAAYINT